MLFHSTACILLAIALILFGNFFAFRDPLKLKSSFKDNQLVQKTSNIQVILATLESA